MNGVGWFFVGVLMSSAAIFLTVEWLLRRKR